MYHFSTLQSESEVGVRSTYQLKVVDGLKRPERTTDQTVYCCVSAGVCVSDSLCVGCVPAWKPRARRCRIAKAREPVSPWGTGEGGGSQEK